MALSDDEFEQLRLFLDSEAARINHPDFIFNDPVSPLHWVAQTLLCW